MKRRSDSWDFDWFIEESKRRFPNKFTYKKTKPFYSNQNSQITVTCKIHGDIVKTPYRHLTNKYGGCAKCGREAMRQSKFSTAEDFIRKAKAVYGSRAYTYEKVKYENCYSYVTVTCTKHGDYTKRALEFLQGEGCPLCRNPGITSGMSWAESLIDSLLRKRKVYYKREFTFDDLIGDRLKLRFDFAVFKNKEDFKSNKVLFLIEFQGAHHFRPGLGGEISHKRTKRYDRKKLNYTIKNGIPLYQLKNFNTVEKELTTILKRRRLYEKVR